MCWLIAPHVHAIKIEVRQGQIDPTPIALVGLQGDAELGSKINEVIGTDLVGSGLFRSISPSAFIQDAASAQTNPRFADWRLVNAQLLFVGKISQENDKIRIEFRLFDVFSGSQMLGLSFSAERTKWRKMAHMIADAIYKRVTGEDGYFDTQMVFIDESGPKGKGRVRRLGVMDYDGFNARYLTDGKHLVVTPRISPNSMEIAYLSYAGGTPSVYHYNITTGRNALLGRFEGMTFAPRFSPDGQSVIFSLEKEGASAIYVMDVKGKQTRQLTPHNSIDTSPCYSPKGDQVVFVSDRVSETDKDSKYVNLFVMDASGSNAKRISFGGGKYFQPVWSPRGDWIAFIKSEEGTFKLGLMRPDGSDERIIQEGYLIEAPSWSANGREIVFTMEKGPKDRPSLYRVNLTGHNLQKVKTPHDASDAAWSKLLSETPTQ